MDLANMREQGVTHLVAFCHNDACRHSALIDVSKYPGDTLSVGNAAVAVDGLTCGRTGKRSR
jgi:hypothetical protein